MRGLFPEGSLMSLFIFVTVIQALVAAALVFVILISAPRAAGWAWAVAPAG